MNNSNKHQLREVVLKHGIPYGKLGGAKGYFHKWTEQAICEENGAILARIMAVIELEDGSLILVDPMHFKFIVSGELLKT